HAKAGAKGESRVVSVLVAVESSGMDEGWRFDAGRVDAATLLRSVRAILREVPAGLCRRRRAGTGDHGTERSGYRPGRQNAGMPVAPGIRDRIRQGPPGPDASAEWPLDQNM